MTEQRMNFARTILAQARHSLLKHHLPRIARCLELLPEEQIWWRPHPTSNSVGNLVLHLSGNVRQWIISGLGGEPDRRERDQEFRERGPIPRRLLFERLQNTVSEAVQILNKLTNRHLARRYSIQGFQVTGLEAVQHVTEHFAHHSGQIIYITKLQLGQDLEFTRLPGQKSKSPGAKPISAI